MLCPQCETEIVVSRPRSYIMDVVRRVERLADRMVLPGVVFTRATLWAGSRAHGIFSRTRYALGLLPALPVDGFVAHRAGQALELNLWPPSAAVTLAALPYLKSFYDSIYERMFGKLERRWIAEVQPHQLDTNDGNALPVHPEPDRPNDDNRVLTTINSEGNTWQSGGYCPRSARTPSHICLDGRTANVHFAQFCRDCVEQMFLGRNQRRRIASSSMLW
ncbi:hypothetical protein CBS63078_10972 [Aspergillus niger]|nr:hypothetical protein CBS13152_11126 [Aspergillus niger]GLA79017.1 hypothetical protein AtubIFM55763_001430 [Aspergillus tubingensis]KAI2869982.1 hypothetical protein CBS11852_11145 [Aspergillus niger]KAI2886411.1 hypothetical protein CBS63078_10972 [Aspergillus niger]KAI3015729.1 hypothetical protein CBS147347_11098 [Aspergillus niger]